MFTGMWRLTIPTVTGVLGLAVGCGLGQRQGFNWGMLQLETEVSGNLSRHVEVASCIRVGDMQRALAFLEDAIDVAVVSLAAQPDPSRSQRVFGQAKLYRNVVPAKGPMASQVTGTLQVVPAPQDSDFCPPPRGVSRAEPSGLSRLTRRVAE
jgi:hypothetical protein